MTAESIVEDEPTVDVSSATRDAHIEAARKFDVPRRWTLPRLYGVDGVARVEAARRFTRTPTYVDTLDLDLLQAAHTLRRSVGGRNAGWRLTKPREDGSRPELAHPLWSSAVRVPEELRNELSQITGHKALVRVATLHTRRTEQRLFDAADKELAVVADDTVEATVYLFGERIYRWREIEVELLAGDRAVLDELTRVLMANGLRVSVSKSKLARALSEARDRLHHRPAVRAEDVVLKYLAAQVGGLQWLEAEVRDDKPDAVHKARVATRRLRSALRTFRPLLNRTVTDPLRREVQWLTGLLGAPRDAEVLLRHFQGMAEELEPELLVGSCVQRLQAHLAAEHERGHARLVQALDGPRYERLMTQLAELLVDPPWQAAAHEPAEQQIPRLVFKADKAVNQAVGAALEAEDPAAREEALHDVRKLIKAARYAAEAATDVVRGASKRTRAWSELQDTLGEYQDSMVARQVIAKISQQARASNEDTFTFGVLVEREAASARLLLGDSNTVLGRARGTARRRVKAK